MAKSPFTQLTEMMSGSAVPQTAESREARKLAEGMTEQDVESLTGIQKIIHYLKKGEWAAMAGAIMGAWNEYFGTDKEKAQVAESRREQHETETHTQTHDQLAGLRQGIEGTNDDMDDGPVAESAQEDNEVRQGTDTLLIGDSIMHGMQGTFPQGERPNFIGRDGFASFRTLERLKRAKLVLDSRESEIRDPNDLKQAKLDAAKLRGPKKALIYTGGNNFTSSSPESIVQNMIDMAKLCQSAGISQVVVCTRFPSDPRRAQGQAYERRKAKGIALREALMKAHEAGRFPAGVELVDLYTRFANADGTMKEEYVDRRSTDTLHPRKAYQSAMSHIQSQLA